MEGLKVSSARHVDSQHTEAARTTTGSTAWGYRFSDLLAFAASEKCQKRTILPLEVWQLVGSIEDHGSGPLIKTSFLDGMLRFVTAIAG